jgi:lysine 2,3-aminomutase
VPNYVIDTPGGGGKVRLLPQNVIGETDGYLALRNYEGKTFHYPTE